jgi:hypothetical protein
MGWLSPYFPLPYISSGDFSMGSVILVAEPSSAMDVKKQER